jgi:hypothetical protein
MKTISVKQPWAWLILHGKDFENRDDSRTSFSGNTLIHASQKPAPGLELIIMDVKRTHKIEVPLEQLQYGGIIGIAEFQPWTRATKSPWRIGTSGGHPITATQILPYYQCKGRLGFWDFPDEIFMKLLDRTIRGELDGEPYPDPETLLAQWRHSGDYGRPQP